AKATRKGLAPFQANAIARPEPSATDAAQRSPSRVRRCARVPVVAGWADVVSDPGWPIALILRAAIIQIMVGAPFPERGYFEHASGQEDSGAYHQGCVSSPPRWRRASALRERAMAERLLQIEDRPFQNVPGQHRHRDKEDAHDDEIQPPKPLNF